MRALARSRLVNVAGLAIALLVLVVIIDSQSPFFLRQNNLLNIGRAVAVTGVIAAVTTIVLIAGELDLSIGATLGLGGIVSASLLAAGLPLVVVLASGLLTGALVGLFNASLIVGVGINPLIATLGTMFALRGAAYIWTNGTSVVTFGHEGFAFLGGGRIEGLPFSVIVLAVVFLVVGAVLTFTRFGSNVYAIGGDRDASRLAGVPVRRVRVTVYVLSGITAAFAGMMLASVNGSADPTSGTGIELVVIGSVILGGTALTGGRGGVSGTVLGVLFLGTLANGMNLLGLPGYWQIFAQGVVLIAAVTIDRLVNRA
jgi:ribose transport system permease protein